MFGAVGKKKLRILWIRGAEGRLSASAVKVRDDGLFEVDGMSANAPRIRSDQFSTGEAQEMQKRGQFSVLSSRFAAR